MANQLVYANFMPIGLVLSGDGDNRITGIRSLTLRMSPLAFSASPLPQGFVDFDLQRAGQTVKNAALAGFYFGRDVYRGGSLKSMPDLSRVMVYAVKTPSFERP